MIKFDIKEPQESIGVVKATVHKNGKLGFSSGAAKRLKLDSQNYFQVATNADDPDDDNLYLIPSHEGADKVFKVSKAGAYYYMRIKHILDDAGMDYREEKIIFDIVNMEQDGMTFYKLTKRR
ncbi:hypothetical protein [Ekhidna sp.]|uniref:hypothetical protein n=1 Tax=Ekhidna sp. TaxID=2608089 RepID=UPI0032EBC8A5